MVSNSIPKYALVAVLLSAIGCASTTDFLSQQQGLEASIEQCLASIEQCLASQSLSNEQLTLQQTQMGEMMAALSGIQRDVVSLETSLAPIEIEEDTIACSPSKPIAIVEASSAKMIVGQREQVWLEDLQLALPARIDTGAETASLDARNIKLFERNGRRWVKFEILHPETNEPIPMERKLKRMALIIQANSSEPERRPVIKLAITVGHITQSAEFTLGNRSHLDYQVLIGRNILQDVMIVDVSKQNAAPPKEPQTVSKSDRGNS